MSGVDSPGSARNGSKSAGGSAGVRLDGRIVDGRIMNEAGTVATADLSRVVVEIAAAAG